MENGTGIIPTYPVGGNMAGDSWIFLFAILALMWGGNAGGIMGGAGNSNAIQADVNRGFDNQNLQAQTRDILSAVTNGTAQTISASTANATNAINAIKDGNATIIREFGNVETALTALSGKQQECCCEIKQAIAQANYDAAMRDAATNANLVAQSQKIFDLIQQNKIDALQAKVGELQNALNNVGTVKYPMSMAYNAGTSPFCGCGCGLA